MPNHLDTAQQEEGRVSLSREVGPTLLTNVNDHAGSNPYSPVHIKYFNRIDTNATAIPDIRQGDSLLARAFCGYDIRSGGNGMLRGGRSDTK